MATDSLTPPFTVTEYASLHGISRATVRKLCEQGRIPHERRGGGATRAAAVLILTAERPPRLPPGSLSPEQRAAWRK